MRRLLTRVGFGIALGCGTAAVQPAAADPPARAPSWLEYVDVSKFVAEVSEYKDGEITVKVREFEKDEEASKPKKGKAPAQPVMKAVLKDHTFKFADAALVRWKNIPPKPPGPDGRPGKYTAEEAARIKLPAGVPGFAAERSDLKEGQGVELTLVRLKAADPRRLTPADLRVKYAIIVYTPPPEKAEPPKGDKGK